MKKRAGRPSLGEAYKIQERILAAAAKLFEVYNFKAVSIRQIAEEADVSVAMVSYYFVDKAGLFAHLLDQVFSKIQEQIKVIDADENLSIIDFIKSYSNLLIENPWFPVFLAKEVYFGDSALKASVLSRYSEDINPLLLDMINQEIEKGNFREDIDPKFALITIGSLLHHPWTIKATATKDSSNLSYTTEAMEKLMQHNCKMFLYGVTER
ncbi:MAG: TetR/AcrR family transcriptional regulator [Pseudohongiellaceae bacterium]